MSDRGEATASLAVDVAAPAETVYGWLSDLDVMVDLAEETQRMEWVSGGRAVPGATFRGTNRNGWRRWSTTCTVTDADRTRFGFDVASGRVPVAHWEYVVHSTGPASCRVTESTWDLRPGWFKVPGALATGVRDRDTASLRHIEATLARLQRYAEDH